MLKAFFHGSLFKIGKCSVQTQNSRDIWCTGFEAVRKKSRNFLCVGNTAGAAADQRFNLRRQFICDQETTDSLRSASAFVAGKCKCVQMQSFHIDRDGSGCLGSIENKQ